MAIVVPCPGCKQSLKVSDQVAGKKVKCPKCSAAVSVPTVTGNGPSADPVHQTPSPQRPTKQKSHLVLWLGLGVAASLVAVILVVCVVAGFFFTREPNQQVAAKSPDTKQGDKQPSSKPPSNSTTPQDGNKPLTDTKPKEEKTQSEKEKTDQARLDEGKKTAAAIENAVSLQAPPLQKGKYHETGEFGGTMKGLAENEFKFREAKNQVYRSTFDQRALVSTPILKRFHARNAVATPGRYDFDAGNLHLDLVFWQALYQEKKKPVDVVTILKSTTPVC